MVSLDVKHHVYVLYQAVVFGSDHCVNLVLIDMALLIANVLTGSL